jgi:hypothetical protein
MWVDFGSQSIGIAVSILPCNDLMQAAVQYGDDEYGGHYSDTFPTDLNILTTSFTDI